ncbi:MAG: RnfABCDGE type electron transport complex subunit G [Candidatus Cloacimonetes bacterium]|jgi:Na+-translocating ferredoxin:NAD+ oxidoreductase subunit G|nr:RnfABCDGE type electron transport complex subunit G [Candidatus Cloacimonadota bacterium]HPI25182.1 RnfABCDGE type electron transport complex subunit G [Candidatus Cloacimonadota bacterium]
MKDYLKLGSILLIFCVVATGILAYLNTLTQPVIAERKANEAVETRKELIPGASFREESTATGEVYYVATAEADSSQVLGYTFVSSETGYSSTVQTMVGVDKDFKVLAIKVISQSETPGLGANCTQPSFVDQFKNLILADLKVDKDGGKVKSLSGATITSRAVTNSIASSIAAIQADLGGEQ